MEQTSTTFFHSSVLFLCWLFEMNLRNSGIFFIHVLQIDDETVDEEDNSVVAQTFLDRVCIALGTCPLPFRLSLSLSLRLRNFGISRESFVHIHIDFD